MARIAGVNIPLNKRVEIGLTYIYGIGRPTSNEILAKLGIEPDRYVRDLTDGEISQLREHLVRRGPADPVDIGQADLDALVEGDVDACDSSQGSLPLSLLVPRVLADDEHAAVPADDLALLTHRLDRRSYLHGPFRC